MCIWARLTTWGEAACPSTQGEYTNDSINKDERNPKPYSLSLGGREPAPDLIRGLG